MAIVIALAYDVIVIGAIVALLLTGHYWVALAILAASELLSLYWIRRNSGLNQERADRELKDIETSLNLIETVLSESDDYVWREKKDGMLQWRMGMVEAMNWGSNTVSIEDFLSIFDYEYGEKVAKIFEHKEPGYYSAEVLATIGGERQWWEFRMRVTRNPDGSVFRRGNIFSIEERKRQEAEMVRIHEMTLNARERSGFIRSMLHEIRTPLNSIIGFSQLISSPDIEFSGDEYDKLCHDVLNENDALVTLIENMLTLSHLNNGTVQFNIGNADVEECVRMAVDTLSELLARNGIKVIIDDSEKGVKARADGNVIVQILLRLLDNSVKFSGGSDTITIGWHAERGKVIIKVTDNGIGIPEEKHAIIFNRFVKLDPYTKGTGIGLAIASEYAEKMKGSISVSSRVGEGSTFYLKFNEGGEPCS